MLGNRVIWLTRFTNWTLLLNALYFVWLAIYSGRHLFKLTKPRVEDSTSNRNKVAMTTQGIGFVANDLSSFNVRLKIHVKILWWLSVVVYDANLVMVVSYWFYWGFIYAEFPFSFIMLNSHGIVFILLLINYSFQMIPVRILHLIHTWTLAAIFLIFSVIYDFVAKKPVYPILNFREKPGTAIGCVLVCFVFVVVARVINYFLYRLKRKITFNPI